MTVNSLEVVEQHVQTSERQKKTVLQGLCGRIQANGRLDGAVLGLLRSAGPGGQGRGQTGVQSSQRGPAS